MCIINVEKKAKVPIFYPFNKTKVSFIVCPFQLPFTGIIGIDIMKKINANLDLRKGIFEIKEKIFNIIKHPSKLLLEILI